MDNAQVMVVGEERGIFDLAMQIAFSQYRKAVGYRVEMNFEETNIQTLVLYWVQCEEATDLPYPMDCTQASVFVWGWLQQAEYGPQPDHDGDNHKGWSVFNNEWGEVAGYKSFVAIRPTWAMYGK